MVNDIQRIQEDHKKFTKERGWDRFQTPKNLSMALSVEAAELVEIFMWLTEAQSISLNEQKLNAAAEEIADIFMYLLRIADTLGIDLIKATDQKMKKNHEKYSVERGIALAQALID
ncbi:MAG: nucleotide pyrophosphohydrolase [Chlamydiota bacterium]|nr:nucleotide pyrophosphohydrolase [Chlamydiota bacterium]